MMLATASVVSLPVLHMLRKRETALMFNRANHYAARDGLCHQKGRM